MAYLIDRERALTVCDVNKYELPPTLIYENKREAFIAGMVQRENDIKQEIKNLTPVDTERHAHWERINEKTVTCSNCKILLEDERQNFFKWNERNKFCRYCGCRMDEVTE